MKVNIAVVQFDLSNKISFMFSKTDLKESMGYSEDNVNAIAQITVTNFGHKEGIDMVLCLITNA